MTRLLERVDDLLRSQVRIRGPRVDGAGRVDANTTVGTDSFVAERAPDFASRFDRFEERFAAAFVPDRGPGPHVGDEGADFELILSAKLDDMIDLRVHIRRIEVRGREEKIKAVELHAVDVRSFGEIEHRLQIETRLAVSRALADDSWPSGVVKFGSTMRFCAARHNKSSFVPIFVEGAVTLQPY